MANNGGELTRRVAWLVLVPLIGLASCTFRGRNDITRSDVRVTVEDLTPRFLAFFDSANAAGADADQRWVLWKRLYHFAAIPPTPFGDTLARRLLDSAWSRYSGSLTRIRQGVAALPVKPEVVLQRVTRLLRCGEGARVRLTVFVGGFEANAFAFIGPDRIPVVAIPIEAGDATRSMTHEFAHAVHRGGCTAFSADYDQSLGELVVSEGLAMRVVEQLVPGHDAAYYTTAAPGWLQAAEAQRIGILRGIREHAAEHGTAQRFTFGRGTTGVTREAYYAGWILVGVMQSEFGMSLHDIAVTPATEYPELVRRAIDRAMAGVHRAPGRSSTK
jgi:predicted Zn-dependent protease DUF2268